jgi:flagellar capping protein FliD
MNIQRLAIIFLLTVLVIFGIYRYGYSSGWGQRDAEMQAEIAKKNEEARQTEQRLAEQLTANTTKLQEANNALDEKQSALDRAIRSGRVRLPAPSCVQAAASPAAGTGDRQEARAEPDREADAASDAERETLRLIAQIAADGDRAINQLNACIDAYNTVREQINGSNH